VVEPLRDALTRGVRTWMLLLLAAVGGVLLIACVNLANLMLVRASARGRELATRAALGASRWDLVRVLFAESLLLSLTGAGLGVCLAWLGVEALRSAIPPDVPRAATIAVDLRVLAAAVLAALASGLLFGAAPVLRFSRPGADAVLAHGTRSSTASSSEHRLRGGLVSLEVALAVVLLAGAGLFLASFARVASVDLGLDPRDVLAVRVRPLVEPTDWQEAQERHRPMLRTMLDQVRTLPGVESAALVNGGVPMRGDVRTLEFAVPGLALPADEDIDFNEISPGYFQVMRVPLRSGRAFTDDDRAGSEPVVILNEAAARRYFPGRDPIGRLVQFEGLRRIVGVVGNMRHDGPESDWRRQGFIPLDQSRAVNGTLVIRLSRGAADVLPGVKAAIWSTFPGTALPDTELLSQYLAALTAQRRFLMLLLGLFGLLGVVIACVGIYGVMAYTVALRTREIGIRMALGAVPAGILWTVLRRAVLYLGAGLALGLPVAWALAGSVSSFLFQVQPHDPWILAAAAAALLVTGLTAAFLPARAAAQVDPLLALRLD
jgi:predicted permease